MLPSLLCPQWKRQRLLGQERLLQPPLSWGWLGLIGQPLACSSLVALLGEASHTPSCGQAPFPKLPRDAVPRQAALVGLVASHRAHPWALGPWAA